MMLKAKLIITSIFLFVNSITAMQENLITGKVLDERTNEPLTGVNIVVNELHGIGTTSDVNGIFNIPVPAGSYSITASYGETMIKTYSVPPCLCVQVLSPQSHSDTEIF